MAATSVRSPSVSCTWHDRPQDMVVKVVLIGDLAVGKSCLLVQFTEHRFPDVQCTTIGVDFATKTVVMRDGSEVALQIWDTAGGEAFRSVTKSYYRNVRAAMIIYDVTRRRSFLRVMDWLVELRQNARDPGQLVIMLVGNKCDCDDRRVVTLDEAQLLAREQGLLFVETSAVTRANVDRAFRELAEEVYNRVRSGTIQLAPEGTGVRLVNKSGASGRDEQEGCRWSCCVEAWT